MHFTQRGKESISRKEYKEYEGRKDFFAPGIINNLRPEQGILLKRFREAKKAKTAKVFLVALYSSYSLYETTTL